MLRTGHSTTTGVRSYKCVGETLNCITSDVLNGSKQMKYEDKEETQESMKTGLSGLPAQFNFAGASNVNVTFNMK